jgi:hypothetical protein
MEKSICTRHVRFLSDEVFKDHLLIGPILTLRARKQLTKSVLGVMVVNNPSLNLL